VIYQSKLMSGSNTYSSIENREPHPREQMRLIVGKSYDVIVLNQR